METVETVETVETSETVETEKIVETVEIDDTVETVLADDLKKVPDLWEPSIDFFLQNIGFCPM